MKKFSLYFLISICWLLLIGSFSSNVFAESERNSNIHSTKIQYLVNTKSNSYYIQFKACIGNEQVVTPTFVIESDVTYKILKYSKVILPNTCKVFETTIKSKHANSINLTMIHSH